MSASAAGLSERVPTRFWSTTIGKKAVMAVSGVVLFGYVIVHMLGNLQVFLPDGANRLDEYAAMLHSHPKFLWSVRSFLILMLALHILAYVQLGARKLHGRPIGYVKKRAAGSSLASRTMYWSGPFIAAYVVYHILHLTTGTLHPEFQEGQVYTNVVSAFQNNAVAIVYIVAIGLLCMHLYHGLWSWMQSLGIGTSRHTPLFKRSASVLAILIGAGYIAVPVAVMIGYLK